MRPMRPMRLRLVAALMVGLAGAGAGIVTTSGAATPTGKVQLDSVGCVETAAPNGQDRTGSCTYVLTDGRRFRCPLSFSTHQQTPATLERAPSCKALTPLVIPRAWRNVFARMNRVQACLANHGISARGGPALDALTQRPRGTLIGELVVNRATPTAFIAFYATVTAAKLAEPRVRENARQIGGEVERRGLVTILWTKPPPPRLGTTTQACAF